MINKDLDLLLLSKLLPNVSSDDVIIPIKLKNESQQKIAEFINMSSVEVSDFKDYFNTTYLIFNGGLNVAKLLHINTNPNSNNFKHFIESTVTKSMNSIRNWLNIEGKMAVITTTPFSNITLNIIKKNHVEYLLRSLDASITIVNNPWITSLRDTLKDLVDITTSNNIDEIDITSLAEYCVLDLVKEDTSENKKVEKLLKMIYG